MTTSSTPTQPGPDQRMVQRFAQRFDELRAALAGRDPLLLAQHCGAELERDGETGVLRLPLWDCQAQIAFPGYRITLGGTDQPASPLEEAFLLYYLTSADGAPLENRWIAFSDLPDGRFYNQAFQGYTGKELARHYGERKADFERAAMALGGRPAQHADAAFTFRPLPRVPVMAAYWAGDEDFPSTTQILFDAAASHYLPTDAYAILGSLLTHRLIKADPTSGNSS